MGMGIKKKIKVNASLNCKSVLILGINWIAIWIGNFFSSITHQKIKYQKQKIK